MNDVHLSRLLLLQSFFDRTTILAREYDEKRLPLEIFGDRVREMSKQFEAALKAGNESR